MDSFAALVKECDAYIRSGRVDLASRRLAKINTAKVPREFRLPLAALCRRASRYSIGLALLAKLVNDKGRRTAPHASPQEIAEYSVLLLRAGALSEALMNLKRVNTKLAPEALLYRSFCHFSVYEFEDAIPLLESYLLCLRDPYQKTVARVNSIFALAGAGRFVQAEEQIAEVLSQDVTAGLARVHSNCYALRAQILLAQSRFSKARQALNSAQGLMAHANTNDQFFIVKWRAFSETLERRETSALNEFRALARNSRDWNALREADFIELKACFSESRFSHLLFGSPYPAYRRMVCSELGREPHSKHYDLWREQETSAAIFDLATGELGGAPILSPGCKTHQVLEALSRDFYRPVSVAGLHSILFQGDVFDVHTSPNRIHQLIRRARHFVEEKDLGVEIAFDEGFYLRPATNRNQAVPFRVELDRETPDLMTSRLEAIALTFLTRGSFTSSEVLEQFPLSRATLQRILQKGVEERRLEKVGRTKSVSYRVLQALPQVETRKAS